MSFSVHIEADLLSRIESIARLTGKPRNAVIRQALRDWVSQRRPAAWPAKVIAFNGIKGAPPFEASRKALKPPREPFDALSA